MVSLVSRSEYVKALESDEYSSALAAFLWDKSLGNLNYTPTSNANEISKCALSALQQGNRALFLRVVH